MIIVLTTRSHGYTHCALTRERRLDLRLQSYDAVFRRRRLPAATYIFTDLDRLGYFELELAARLYRGLREAGLKTLNDPARVSQRFKLLRQLKSCGINDFNVWSLNDVDMPDRYPVFLRTASAHRGVLSGVLENRDELDRAIAEAVNKGIPERELLAVGYCAEPVAPGLFRKLSVYRIGDRMISTTCVHDRHWVAKLGVKGIASAALYEDEQRIVRDNPHGEQMREVFSVANIDYGRADFALVRGRPQIYEINTNPMIKAPQPHPVKARVESYKIVHDRLVAAFAELDGASSTGHVDILIHPCAQTGLRSWLAADRSWRP